MRRRFAALARTVAAVLALALAGCESPVTELGVGTCFNGGGSEQVATVTPVDCATAHDKEVFAEFEHVGGDGAPFPGADQLDTFAEGRCTEAFGTFVGLSFDQSVLELYYLLPTEETWAEGDRLVTCLLAGPSGEKLTGSMKDVRR